MLDGFLVCKNIKEKKEREREGDTEDDTYVLWDDDECDPLALLMVDRKTEIFEARYTKKYVHKCLVQ